MIAQDFLKLVWDMARTEGNPYIKFSESALLTDHCQECLNVYASKTQCIQSDKVTFTPKVDESSYDMFVNPQTQGATTIPSYLSAAVCFVRQVYINGAPLKILGDPQGRPGESSEFLVTEYLPGYLTAQSGPPCAWWQEPPVKLRFDKGFDQVYPNCFIVGRLYHSPLLLASQVLDLPPEDIRPAAELAAGHLLVPLSREKGMAMVQAAEAQMLKRFGECGVKIGGTSRRGTTVPRRVVNLAR